MWLIFNAVSPAMQFKRGVQSNEDEDFPDYSLEGEIMESDGELPGFEAYKIPLYE